MATYAKAASGSWVNLDAFTALSVGGAGTTWYIQASSTQLAGTYTTQALAQAALDAYVVERGEATL